MKNKIGLSVSEVQERICKGQINTVELDIFKTNFRIVWDNLVSIFNILNIAIGVSLALVGAYKNMAFLFIIFLNLIIGIIQEIRAKNLVKDLKLVTANKVVVIRDDSEVEVNVSSLVLDDVMILNAGNQVSSDSIVLDGEVEVNESLLTGEADVILKLPGDKLLSGSFLVSGKCYAKVQHIGKDNYSAKLTTEAKKIKEINSNLLKSMRKVSRFTSFFIVPLGLIMFLQNYFFKEVPLDDSVVTTSAALLGMLPKGLILLISISLATGVIKLSKKRVLVQELHCLETLANVDILCLDKTGTITVGKMKVSEVLHQNGNFSTITFEQAIGTLIKGSDDSNATFLALKEHFKLNETLHIISKVPFSSERKWSAVTLITGMSIILGAPEKLFLNKKIPPDILKLQQCGKRVLCLGVCNQPLGGSKLPEIKLMSIIGLEDPIRADVKETLNFFKNEKVALKIISGDNPITVSTIAKEAGIENYNSYIDMSEIKTEQELEHAALKYTVFGRVSPFQKSQLVKSLQKNGHTVGMTGDGVNDVIALKEADCSVAMNSGSDAAKQVSQLVLLDSNFNSLPAVVMEGRRVVNNITKVGVIFFIKTIYSLLLTIYCILTNSSFPFITMQILVIDVIIEGFPSLIMSFTRSPKQIKSNFIRYVFKQSLAYALLIVFAVIAVNLIKPLRDISDDEASTILYYLVGFASILAVFKSCQPFNKLRVLLFATVAVGFFTTVILATLISDRFNVELLHTVILTPSSTLLFGLLALWCIPLRIIFSYIINKLYPEPSK